MAPRKSRKTINGDAAEYQAVEESGELKQSGAEGEASEKNPTTVGDKRKKSPPPESAHKAIKASKYEQATKSHEQASPEQVVKFLLSSAAVEACRPEDETEDLSRRGQDIKTYAQLLSPFEELICAVVLSRPISHRLGLRTIRTILNEPYEFKDPETIKAAGAEKVHHALDDAHTQHKGKTTEEIELLAEAVKDNDWHNDLEKIRKQANNTVDKKREVLRTSIKGLGKTGLDIFYRRIQWLWEEAYPFVDARTQESLQKLGLPNKPEQVVDLIEENWNELVFEDSAEFGEEERKRRAFVLLLERCVAADLEKKIEYILTAAAKS